MNPQKIWHYAISYYRHGNATAYLKLDNAQYLYLCICNIRTTKLDGQARQHLSFSEIFLQAKQQWSLIRRKTIHFFSFGNYSNERYLRFELQFSRSE